LKTVYPEHQHVWQKFKPHNTWTSIEHQRRFFNQLMDKWNITKPEDWFMITGAMVLKEGGNFISKYNNSVIKTLQAIYPEHQHVWHNYKPRGYWKDLHNQKKFLDSLMLKWNINKPEDWFNITTAMVLKEGGSFIRSYYDGSLVKGNVISCYI
jgi:hypothetical protein